MSRQGLREIREMKYCNFVESQLVYELDDLGNKIVDYVDSDGKVWYRTNGTTRDSWSEPTLFHATISSSLNPAHATAYGVSQDSIYSEITIPKGSANLKFGSKVWWKNAIKRKEDNTVDDSSADYTCKGVLTEFASYDFYLLQRQD